MADHASHGASIATRTLEPHAPLPDGRHVSVLRRFDEDNPDRVITEIVLGHDGGRSETANPARPDGAPMSLPEAVEAGKRVAETEGIHTVFVVDRTAGPREHEILEHGGDHSVNMAHLDDMDLEDGERGPDMRDGVRYRPIPATADAQERAYASPVATPETLVKNDAEPA
jgi:hypothetical protein